MRLVVVINDIIREQVITDLKSELIDENNNQLIALYINGLPIFLEVSDPNDPTYIGDIPALSVSISNGEPTNDDFDNEEWAGTLLIRIYLVASNIVDSELDRLGQRVLSVINRDYTAHGLLGLCNRSSFTYGRDDEQPWGMLDLSFAIEYKES